MAKLCACNCAYKSIYNGPAFVKKCDRNKDAKLIEVQDETI